MSRGAGAGAGVLRELRANAETTAALLREEQRKLAAMEARLREREAAAAAAAAAARSEAEALRGRALAESRQRAAAEDEARRLRAQLEEAQRALAAAGAHVVAAERDASEAAALRSKADDAERALAAERLRTAALEADRVAARAAGSDSLAELQRAVRRLVSENREGAEALARARDEARQLASSLSEERRARESAAAALAETQTRLRGAEARLEEAASARDALVSSAADAAAAFMALREAAASDKARRERAEADGDALRARLSEAELHATARLGALERLAKDAKDEAANERAARAAAEARVEGVATLEAELAAAASQLARAYEGLEGAFTCVSCMQLFADPVLCVPCGHTCCRRCLVASKGAVHCPECGAASAPPLVAAVRHAALDVISGRLNFLALAVGKVRARFGAAQPARSASAMSIGSLAAPASS